MTTYASSSSSMDDKRPVPFRRTRASLKAQDARRVRRRRAVVPDRQPEEGEDVGVEDVAEGVILCRSAIVHGVGQREDRLGRIERIDTRVITADSDAREEYRQYELAKK
ncbi:hypothetical protein PsorP6_001696 [Peronosclerospora sorghi]|uniref:Uncharacterized protein n=1 Tax=Peronosclerospora sorghi TaxID=230839 RepID=A0ACC0WS84_9STRA|nr:hypothetical protein PsorP6_001696 [Peronosclerospora sorghi]